VIFGVVGDVHGDFDALQRAMERHAGAAFWLSVGDLASDDKRYPRPVAPLYWIQGNNEDFEFIATGLASGGRTGVGGAPANLHFLPNGTRSAMERVVVAALGGTFAPTWYHTPAAELPFPAVGAANGPRHWHPSAPPPQRGCRVGDPGAAAPGAPPFRQGDEAERGVGPPRARSLAGYGGPRHSRDDKRRHFVLEQVEALKALHHVDVLLTHEAPRPFIVQAGHRRLDAGKTVINELLAALHPRLHFFGHHHRYSDAVRDPVRSIGLDLVSRSYVLVDSGSFEMTKVDAEA